MTVQAADMACAGWSYVDERGDTCWKMIVKMDGQWTEIADDGTAYDQDARKMRLFIDSWIAEATDDPAGTPMPSPDTIGVYRACIEFMEAHT